MKSNHFYENYPHVRRHLANLGRAPVHAYTLEALEFEEGFSVYELEWKDKEGNTFFDRVGDDGEQYYALVPLHCIPQRVSRELESFLQGNKLLRGTDYFIDEAEGDDEEDYDCEISYKFNGDIIQTDCYKKDEVEGFVMVGCYGSVEQWWNSTTDDHEERPYSEGEGTW